MDNTRNTIKASRKLKVRFFPHEFFFLLKHKKLFAKRVYNQDYLTINVDILNCVHENDVILLLSKRSKNRVELIKFHVVLISCRMTLTLIL